MVSSVDSCYSEKVMLGFRKHICADKDKTFGGNAV